MKKHLYYEVEPEDKKRVNSLVKRYVDLVGHLPMEAERILPAAYEKNFDSKTIHNYDKAFNVMEEMLGRINMKRSGCDAITDMSLRSLYREIRAEEECLSAIFQEFEAIGIYVD